MQDQPPVVRRRGDVQKRQLVRTLLVVARGNFDRVARIAQFDEVNTFDDAATCDVQARNDAFGEHSLTHLRRLTISNDLAKYQYMYIAGDLP